LGGAERTKLIKEEFMAKVGDVKEGPVKNITKSGVFVDIGDEDGMIPQSEETRNLRRGDKVKVKVTEIINGGKIRLSFLNVISSAMSQERPRPESRTASQKDDHHWAIMRESFYSDPEKKILKEELFTSFARELARSCVQDSKPPLSTNALRNFYDAIKAIENPILQAGGPKKQKDAFAIRKPYVKLLAANVAHKSKDLTPHFTEFLHRGIDMSNTLEEFKGFVLVFEAVAGWHSEYINKEK
jgi:CRISPR type III-A-associated protein Csm2